MRWSKKLKLNVDTELCFKAHAWSLLRRCSVTLRALCPHRNIFNKTQNSKLHANYLYGKLLLLMTTFVLNCNRFWHVKWWTVTPLVSRRHGASVPQIYLLLYARWSAVSVTVIVCMPISLFANKRSKKCLVENVFFARVNGPLRCSLPSVDFWKMLFVKVKRNSNTRFRDMLNFAWEAPCLLTFLYYIIQFSSKNRKKYTRPLKNRWAKQLF